MPYKLISTDSDQSFELRDGPPLVVGRALNSDIPVFDPTISRRHAELSVEDGGVRLRDLGSSNGTFVNGARVENARVTPGDVISFGKVAFRVKEVPAPAPEHTPVTTGTPSGPIPGATVVRASPVRDRGGILAAVR